MEHTAETMGRQWAVRSPTDSPQRWQRWTRRCRWAGSRRRWAGWAAAHCREDSQSVSQSHANTRAAFNVTLLITLTGSSPSPKVRGVPPPAGHIEACQGDRPAETGSTRSTVITPVLVADITCHVTLQRRFQTMKSRGSTSPCPRLLPFHCSSGNGWW